jgi:hypothetical protein
MEIIQGCEFAERTKEDNWFSKGLINFSSDLIYNFLPIKCQTTKKYLKFCNRRFSGRNKWSRKDYTCTPISGISHKDLAEVLYISKLLKPFQKTNA